MADGQLAKPRVNATEPGGPRAPTLELRELHVQLGNTPALCGVSVRFAPGRLHAVIGPNGAGKSTLLRALLGHHGPVWAAGRPLHARARPRLLAYLSQGEPLPEDATVRGLVELGRGAAGWLGGLLPLRAFGPQDAAAVARAMAQTGVTALAERRLGELSGGERQRAALARALAGGAPWLLLDEPTNHLDLAHGWELLRLLQEQVAAGLGVIAVLHDLSLASLADELHLLQGGQLLASGPPEAVLTPANLQAAYGVRAEVLPHRGRLLVLPAGERA